MKERKAAFGRYPALHLNYLVCKLIMCYVHQDAVRIVAFHLISVHSYLIESTASLADY